MALNMSFKKVFSYPRHAAFSVPTHTNNFYSDTSIFNVL